VFPEIMTVCFKEVFDYEQATDYSIDYSGCGFSAAV
jgi:hypothetical protein